MPQPDGKLTPVQYQIMAAVWDRNVEGATATEIWEVAAQDRDVGRTTVLKQIQRLESRRWLLRKPAAGATRYVAALDRDETAQMLATEFVEDFFDGSLANLVQSVLGTQKIKGRDVTRLRQLLDEHNARRNRKGEL